MPGVPWARFDTDSIIHMSRVIISVVVRFSFIQHGVRLSSHSVRLQEHHVRLLVHSVSLLEQSFVYWNMSVRLIKQSVCLMEKCLFI